MGTYHRHFIQRLSFVFLGLHNYLVHRHNRFLHAEIQHHLLAGVYDNIRDGFGFIAQVRKLEGNPAYPYILYFKISADIGRGAPLDHHRGTD